MELNSATVSGKESVKMAFKAFFFLNIMSRLRSENFLFLVSVPCVKYHIICLLNHSGIVDTEQLI